MALFRDKEENSIALILLGKHVIFQVVSAKPLETSWSTDPPGTTYDLLQRNGVYRGCAFVLQLHNRSRCNTYEHRDRETVLLSICSWNTSEPRDLGTLGYPQILRLFRSLSERAISKIYFYDRVTLKSE